MRAEAWTRPTLQVASHTHFLTATILRNFLIAKQLAHRDWHDNMSWAAAVFRHRLGYQLSQPFSCLRFGLMPILSIRIKAASKRHRICRPSLTFPPCSAFSRDWLTSMGPHCYLWLVSSVECWFSEVSRLRLSMLLGKPLAVSRRIAVPSGSHLGVSGKA